MLLSQANGTSRLHETIFEDRLEWLSELRRLGARVDLLDEHHAVDPRARPAARGGSGNGRPAGGRFTDARRRWRHEGTSLIHGAHHVRRGYENIEGKFLDLGAQIERVSEGAGVTNS